MLFRSKALLIATILVVIATLALPYTPLAEMIGFEALPAYFYIYIVGIMVLYVASAEVAKKVFYAWIDRSD